MNGYEDTYLIHTLRMALRDHLKRPEIFAKHKSLDQPDTRLHRLLDVIPGVRDAPSATFVLSALEAGKYEPGQLAELIHYATRYAADDQLDAAARYVLTWQEADLRKQLAAFRSFGLAIVERGGRIPERFYPWAERLASALLQDREPARVVEGIQLAGSLKLRPLYRPLAKIAESADQAAELRLAAIQAAVATGDPRRLALFDAILGNPDEGVDLRRGAALALSLVNTGESRKLLLARLLTAHHRLAADIAAALAGTRPGAEMLLGAIAQGKASPLLLRDLRVHRNLEAAKPANLSQRLAKLTENLPPVDELAARLIAQRRKAFLASRPNARRGREVFEKNCAICHQMEGEGKKFGPDLDGIGLRGLDRLLEDLLDPNRNVDPAFRSTSVITDAGLTRTGLALRDEGNVLILVDAEGNELRISHDEIEERFTSALSPMPNAAEKTVDPADFNHLMQFLLEAAQPPKDPNTAD